MAFIYLIAFFAYQPWKSTVLGGADSSGYYAYLPAVFIHGDIETLDKCNETRREYLERGIAKTPKLENGKHLNQYTYGLAFLNLPAFVIAHTYAKISSHKADGYSPPYNFAIAFSGLLYVLAGLLFLQTFLSNFFNEKVIAMTTLAIGLGTNLYFTAILQNAMAHGYLFFLVAVFISLIQKWKSTRASKYFYWSAFILGMITLVRPNVLVVGLFPLFFASDAVWETFKRPMRLIPALLLFILALIPQFIYWKIITGSFITYSYGEQSFDFLHPHLLEGLTGFKNGWLVYTPIMIFSILGLVISLWKKKTGKWFGIALIVFIHVYVIYSWWCWNYINGFGSRAMVDIYPVLAIPMASFFTFLEKKKVQYPVFISIFLFILLNLFQTHQHWLKVLWSEGGTAAYYQAVFAKTELNHDILVALDCNIRQAKNLHYKISLEEENFSKDSSALGAGIFCIQPGKEFSPGIKTRIPDPGLYQKDWFRISVDANAAAYTTYFENSHLVLSINRGEEQLFWRSVRINNKIRDQYYSVHNGEINRWKTVDFFVPVKPIKLKPADDISVYAWNPGQKPVYIDNIKLEIWSRKEH